MGVFLLLAFILVPVLEIYVIIQVGHAIGALPTVLLLLVDGLVGAAIVRREGAKAWGSLRESVASGRLPTREIADGACIVLGGALLLSPGFVTDVFGLFLVLPFTRPLARRFLARAMGRRIRVVSTAGPGRPPRDPRGQRPGGGSAGDVIEGEVVDEQPSDTTNRPDQIGRAG
jgi:UPF0716 protein FxsA